MSDGLKQRIVGAIVLGALGVILLPLLLDFTDPKKIDRTSLIPAAPTIDAVEYTAAKRPAEVKDSSEVEKKTRELLLAVESFESAIEVSRGRRRASENTFLIVKIAEFFEKNLPGLVISASTSTKFCKVIAFILSEVLEPRLTNSEEPTYKDPRRQIENALEVFRASK